jgi:hypothetical protein
MESEKNILQKEENKNIINVESRKKDLDKNSFMKWDPFITNFEKDKTIVDILNRWTYEEILS